MAALRCCRWLRSGALAWCCLALLAGGCSPWVSPRVEFKPVVGGPYLELAGSIRLLELQRELAVLDPPVDLVICGGGWDRPVEWSGRVGMGEVRGLLESQIGPVLVRGSRWSVFTSTDGKLVRTGAYGSGPSVVWLAGEEGVRAQLMANALGSSRVVKVSVVARSLDAKASVGPALGGVGLSATGAWSLASASVIDGAGVEVRDSQTRQVQGDTTVLSGGGAAVQSVTTQEGGLILVGRIASVGAKWHFVGSFELSSLTGSADKTTRHVAIDRTLVGGDRVELCQLRKADVSATVAQRWGLSGTGGVFVLEMVVEELER
jgi:hypothetical protein